MTQNSTKPNRPMPPSTPGWVKVFGIILVVLILAVVVMHLTGTNFGNLHHIP